MCASALFAPGQIALFAMWQHPAMRSDLLSPMPIQQPRRLLHRSLHCMFCYAGDDPGLRSVLLHELDGEKSVKVILV